MALVLVLGAGIGGTVAWLQTKTATVTNTFVVGDIGALTLTETKTTVTDGTPTNETLTAVEGGENKKNDTFVIVPGVDLTKDPKVAYNAHDDSVDDIPVYVFVKIDAANGWTVDGAKYDYKVNDAALISFTVDSGWNPVTGQTGVYYKALDAKTDLAAASVITDNKITVSQNITKEQLAAITDPSIFNLVFTAYAIQQQGHDNVAAAWTAVSAAATNTNP